MLLGRDAERGRLRALLAGARSGASAALVLRGDPGIGKSALLEDTIAAAAGMTVLRARGVESESELAYAGMADLLRPVMGRLDDLPPPQRAVLAGALALGPPVPADRFTLYAATFGLLAAAAEEGPVLGAVDDAPWIDAPSREALVFVARRLQEEGIVLLLAARTGEAVGSEAAGVPELTLDGLDGRAATALLTRAGGDALAPAVAERLVAATGGNPLALLELPPLLSPAQRAGVEPIEDPPPIGTSVERAYGRRIDALPEPSQRALVVAAASESGAMDELVPALAALGLDATALEPAETAGLIAVAGGALAFRHPLLRSVAYRHVPAPQQRVAHATLAGVLAGERRAWHLAAAAVATDEAVAAELAVAAADARVRSGPAAAMRAAERAARLTPDPGRRAARLLEAAADLVRVGRPDRGQALLAEALELDPEPRVRADIQHLHALVEARTGAAASAARLLVAEAQRVEPLDPVRAATMITAAVQPCFEAGDQATGLATARRGVELAERAGLGRMPAGLPLGMALLLTNERGQARPILHDAVAWLEQAEDPWALGPVLVFGIAQAFMWFEEYETARRLVEGAIARARAMGAPGLLPYGLLVACELDFRTDRWPAAYASGTEAVRLADETGQPNDTAYSLAVLARLEAALGHEDKCRQRAAACLELVDRLGAEVVRAYAWSVLGFLELGRGRSEEAITALEAVARFLDERPRGDPAVLQWPPDLVEAYVRTGRTREAETLLAAFERDAERSGSPWALGAAARCRGLLAGDDGFEAPFRAALTHHRSGFETARTELCLGERLRRGGRRVEARARLRSALATFERLGALPWAERARAELRASGERVRRGEGPAAGRLTPQELQVALVVAQGATNREAATALFLSPKTIEFHLRNVYRKLGVRSRTELARAMLSGAPED